MIINYGYIIIIIQKYVIELLFYSWNQCIICIEYNIKSLKFYKINYIIICNVDDNEI